MKSPEAIYLAQNGSREGVGMRRRAHATSFFLLATLEGASLQIACQGYALKQVTLLDFHALIFRDGQCVLPDC